MSTNKLVPTINRVLEKSLAPVAPFINPNFVSALGFLFPILSFVLISKGIFLYGSLSMLLFIVDKLDGVLARAGNHVSKWGGLLDATLDRISDSLIYIAIGYSGSADWGLCSIAMLMGLLVSYSKAKAEAGLGISNIGSNQMSIGLMERTERLVLVGVSLFVYYFVSKDLVFNLNIVEIVLVISIILTFLTFVMRMKKAHELLKAQ